MTSKQRAVSGTDGRIAALIEADIEGRGLTPGSRLPTEREMADQLGLTRTAVRRGLATLDAKGRVSREVGRGTFLRPLDGSDAEGNAPLPDDVGPADVMAVRHLFEPQVIPLVVSWATNRDLDEMERCLVGGSAAQSHEEFEVWDAALHRSVVAASHSQLLVRVFAVIDAARHGPLWGDLKRRGFSRQRQHDYQRDHEELVRALRVRDAERATQVMRAHLVRVESNLLGTREASTGSRPGPDGAVPRGRDRATRARAGVAKPDAMPPTDDTQARGPGTSPSPSRGRTPTPIKPGP
ncbi:MAG: FadR/GntR family transcriptional regulator [Acidimicrobiales bacterium]